MSSASERARKELRGLRRSGLRVSCDLSSAHQLWRDQLPGAALALRVLCVPHLPQTSGGKSLHFPREQHLLRGLLQDRCGQEVPRMQEPHHRSDRTPPNPTLTATLKPHLPRSHPARLCRVRPRHQRGELRGLQLARVLLQLQEVLPVAGQQALRHQSRPHLLPRLRQEGVSEAPKGAPARPGSAGGRTSLGHMLAPIYLHLLISVSTSRV